MNGEGKSERGQEMGNGTRMGMGWGQETGTGKLETGNGTGNFG